MQQIVLIITNRPSDAESLQRILERAEDGPFVIERATSLYAALHRIHANDIDIILLDFFLPDCHGAETFDRVFAVASPVPIVTLVYDEKIELARDAVQRGAQGYLLKGHFENELVPQALRNTIERKLVEDALFVEKERASVTLDSIADAVISTNDWGSITYMNVAAERITGWVRENATGRPVEEVFNRINSNTRMTMGSPVARVIQERSPREFSTDCILMRPDLEEIPIEDSTAPIYDRRGNVTGAVIVFRNIGPAQSSMAEQMRYLAHHDTLTGLPNRALLDDRLEIAISLAKRNNTSLGVLFLDLDKFKNINDSLGHTMGDRLLKSVAVRLQNCIRASDTVCRYGGDEFVVLVAEENSAEDAGQVAEKIIAALAPPHIVLEHLFYTTISIGISTYPADGHDGEALIKNADTAMYYAKRNGGNCFQFFNAMMNQHAIERHVIEADLRRAIDHNELVLHYQPKVNLQTGVTTGVEALVRWQHPQRGLILPGQFVSIAEECGLIVPIGLWVLQEACKQAKLWSESGFPSVSMAVNVSALEFRSRHFLSGIRRILEETGQDPQCLELEMTEGLLMSSSEYSKDLLHSLRKIGLRLSIDDFGTGYSSLSYLQEFPIDVLKIDQSFVRGIAETEGKRIIVTAVIGMGKNLKYRVIAEGVETREQFLFLKEHGCDEGQGYYFSRPLIAAHCTELLEAGIPEHLIK